MAYFRCVGGSGGAGATITVTYSSQFYNKTMTCTKGTKTYTKTTTSSGSTVFDVDETGTWTITCDGTSRTVDVVLEYSTQMAITKTITVYGAASETISFTDVTGAKTVTTDSSGEGSVSITFIPNSAITFTSSIAKNPSDLSQAYSKAITLTNSTTSINVMPDGEIYYWYGYSPIAMEASWFGSQGAQGTVSLGTNYVSFNHAGTGNLGYYSSATHSVTVGKVIKTIYYYGSNNNEYNVGTFSNKTLTGSDAKTYKVNITTTNPTGGTTNFSSVTVATAGDYYIAVNNRGGTAGTSTVYCYALWIE